MLVAEVAFGERVERCAVVGAYLLGGDLDAEQCLDDLPQFVFRLRRPREDDFGSCCLARRRAWSCRLPAGPHGEEAALGASDLSLSEGVEPSGDVVGEAVRLAVRGVHGPALAWLHACVDCQTRLE